MCGRYVNASKIKAIENRFNATMKQPELYKLSTNTSIGEIVSSFAIITTAPTDISQKIGHHRSPVILNMEEETDWLHHQTPLGEATSLLHSYANHSNF